MGSGVQQSSHVGCIRGGKWKAMPPPPSVDAPAATPPPMPRTWVAAGESGKEDQHLTLRVGRHAAQTPHRQVQCILERGIAPRVQAGLQPGDVRLLHDERRVCGGGG